MTGWILWALSLMVAAVFLDLILHNLFPHLGERKTLLVILQIWVLFSALRFWWEIGERL